MESLSRWPKAPEAAQQVPLGRTEVAGPHPLGVCGEGQRVHVLRGQALGELGETERAESGDNQPGDDHSSQQVRIGHGLAK